MRPTEIVLLPLYPQFSSTTTASSLADLAAEPPPRPGLRRRPALICCYPTEPGFIAALASADAARRWPRRSAAGRPSRASVLRPWPAEEDRRRAAIPIRAGGARRRAPSPTQLGLGDERLARLLSEPGRAAGMDRALTDEEIVPGGRSSVGRRGGARSPSSRSIRRRWSSSTSTIAIWPREAGVPAYVRVPTVGTAPAFIAGLADLVRQALAGDRTVRQRPRRRGAAPRRRAAVCQAAIAA